MSSSRKASYYLNYAISSSLRITTLEVILVYADSIDSSDQVCLICSKQVEHLRQMEPEFQGSTAHHNCIYLYIHISPELVLFYHLGFSVLLER